VSRRLDLAKQKLARADTYLRVSKVVFALYMVTVTGLLTFQLYDIQRGQVEQLKSAQESLDKSIGDNARQHERTQDYIKCVASALLTPLADRSAAIFDQCGLDADKASQASAPATTNTTVAPTAPPPAAANTSSSTQQPTTSSPPDPEEVTPPRGPIESTVDVIVRPILEPVDDLLLRITNPGR